MNNIFELKFEEIAAVSGGKKSKKSKGKKKKTPVVKEAPKANSGYSALGKVGHFAISAGVILLGGLIFVAAPYSKYMNYAQYLGILLGASGLLWGRSGNKFIIIR